MIINSRSLLPTNILLTLALWLVTKIVRISPISRNKKIYCIMNYQLSTSTIERTQETQGKKMKDRYFEFTLRRKRQAGPVRAMAFERIACQTPRCRNVIYDGVRLEISPYNSRAVTTLRVPPKERIELKMRKQLPVQPCAPISGGYTFASYEPRLESLAEENGLETFDLGIYRARVRSDGFFNEHGYCAPIIRE